MTSGMVQIDGSQGEGGGQILRSSLALSMATGRPFKVTRIRAGRAKPGLMRQHLTAVTAAQTICGAEVVGADVASQELEFRPGAVRPGEYTFPIGTAGSTMLVLQAILPPLLTAGAPSRIVVEGGTHAKAAPPFEFFERALVPLLCRMGPVVRPRLEHHGFYPAGGGRVVVEVEPVPRLSPLHLLERGEPVSRRLTILLSRIGFSVAEREMAIIRDQLGWEIGPHNVVQPEKPAGAGNAVLLEVASSAVTDVFSGIGEMGKTAERVAGEAVTQVREYLASGAAVGPHLADQLMVPIALAGAGSFSTSRLTAHARTNQAVIQAFLPVPIRSEGSRRAVWSVG